MATLYKRATPAQHRILRIVEGAVINVADAHGCPRDPYMARSIAKRATGTLTAGWPEVLAARSLPPSGKAGHKAGCPACERRAQSAKRLVRLQRMKGYDRPLSNGERQRLTRRSPLYPFWLEIKTGMWAVERSGDTVRLEIYRDLLRRLDKAMRREFETLTASPMPHVANSD